MPKKLKEGTLLDFSLSILSQNIKKLKGDPLRKIRRKFHKAKKTERGPFSLARYSMLRGKTGKTLFGLVR